MEVRVGGGIVRVRNIFIISCNQRRIEKEMVINHENLQRSQEVENVYHKLELGSKYFS